MHKYTKTPVGRTIMRGETPFAHITTVSGNRSRPENADRLATAIPHLIALAQRMQEWMPNRDVPHDISESVRFAMHALEGKR